MFSQRAYDLLIFLVSLCFLAFLIYVWVAGWTLARGVALIGTFCVAMVLFGLRGVVSPRFKEGLVYPFFLLAGIELLLQFAALGGLLPSLNINDPVAFGRVYQNQEGFAHGLRNRHGWFSQRADFSPKAKRRVLLIGDSYIEAPHVPTSQHIGMVLERHLQPESAEVLAIGRSGFGPAQYLELLSYGIEAFDPTEVVLFLFLGNDLRAVDQVQELADKPNHTAERWIYYQLDEVGQPVLDVRSLGAQKRLQQKIAQQHAGFWHNLPRSLRSHAFALNIVERLKRGRPKRGRLASSVPNDEFASLGLNRRYFEPPLSPADDSAYALVMRLLVKARDELASEGIGLTVVTIPIFPPSFYAQQNGRDWSPRFEKLDLLLPERRLRELNVEHNLHFLFMGHRLKAMSRSVEDIQNLFFVGGSGHFTALGHATFAQELARFLAPP